MRGSICPGIRWADVQLIQETYPPNTLKYFSPSPVKKKTRTRTRKRKRERPKKKREERNEEEEKEKFRYQQHIGTMYSPPGEDTLAWCDV